MGTGPITIGAFLAAKISSLDFGQSACGGQHKRTRLFQERPHAAPLESDRRIALCLDACSSEWTRES
jgi:hypothetical protein